MKDAFELMMPLWKIIVRISMVYLAIVVLIGVVPKQSTGSISLNDMLALVLVGAIAADGQISVVKTRT